MSAALLVAIALGAAAAATFRGPAGWRLPLLAGGIALALFAIVAAVADPLRIAHVVDTPLALGTDGAVAAAAAGVSLLLLMATSLTTPEPAGAAASGGSAGPLQDAAAVVPGAHAAAALPGARAADQRERLAPALVATGAALAALTATIGVQNGALMAPGAGPDAGRPLALAPVITFALSTAAAALGAALLAAGSDLVSLVEAVRVASRTLRLDVVAGVVGLAGAGWLLAEHGMVGADPNGIAAAIVLVCGGLAMLTGSIPFHAVAARAGAVGSGMLLAARSIWVPAAFALGAIGWDQHVLLPELGFGGIGATPVVADVRALVWILAVATLVGGALTATVRGDLRHVAVYAILADWALVLVVIAAADPARASSAHDWIAVNAVSKTALVGWCVAVSGAFGSTDVDELAGWARRAPLLLVSLVAIGLATFGIPGTGVLSVRASLVVGGGIGGTILLGASWLGLLPYLRLAIVGLRRPSQRVAGALSERPVWPGLRGAAGSTAVRRVRGAMDLARLAWSSNAVPIAALLTLAAALLAAALSLAVGGQPAQVQ